MTLASAVEVLIALGFFLFVLLVVIAVIVGIVAMILGSAFVTRLRILVAAWREVGPLHLEERLPVDDAPPPSLATRTKRSAWLLVGGIVAVAALALLLTGAEQIFFVALVIALLTVIGLPFVYQPSDRESATAQDQQLNA